MSEHLQKAIEGLQGLELSISNRISELESVAFNNEEQIRLIKQLLNGATPPPLPEPPTYEGITVGPDDNLQEAISDANGQKIWLKDGLYEPFKVVSNTRLQAMNPKKAIVDGTIDWSDGWVAHGDKWFKPLPYSFYQHPAKSVHTENGAPSVRGLLHREAMRPQMLLWKGEVMQPVYESKDLVAGTFMLEGTSASPKGIWANFEEAPSPLTVRLAISQYLIKGMTSDVDGVEIDGLTLQHCANTGTFGALHMDTDMEHWKVTNTDILWSMSEGIRMKGANHIFENCNFNHHGHVGIALQGLFRAQVLNCTANNNVWRKGVDPLWHAGALKGQYGVNECLFKGYTAENNNGAGFWLDIYNKSNILDDFSCINNSAFGVHIEHNTTNGIVSNGQIIGTRDYRGVSSGLRIQRSVSDYLFQNLVIKDNAGGAVYYKKREERGNSGRNRFDNIKYSGNGNNNRFAIQGDLNNMPDEYINMATPDFRNWP